MGKSTISMSLFYVANCKRLPEGNYADIPPESTQEFTLWSRLCGSPVMWRVLYNSNSYRYIMITLQCMVYFMENPKKNMDDNYHVGPPNV